MPTPLALNDDEYSAVMQAAQPVHPLQRGAFLEALAQELEKHPVVGPGVCAPLRRRAAASLRCRGAQRNVALSWAATFEGAPGGRLNPVDTQQKRLADVRRGRSWRHFGRHDGHLNRRADAHLSVDARGR